MPQHILCLCSPNIAPLAVARVPVFELAFASLNFVRLEEALRLR